MKNTPLRNIRKYNNDSLADFKRKLGGIGCLSSTGNLSYLERGKTWPSKHLVSSISKLYGISEMEILYPEKFKKESDTNER